MTLATTGSPRPGALAALALTAALGAQSPLGRQFDHGDVSRDDLFAILAKPGPELADAAAILVHEIAPLEPAQLAGVHAEALPFLVRALAERPRRELGPWLRTARDRAATAELALLAIAGLPPAAMTEADGRFVLEHAAQKGDDRAARLAAMLAADRLPGAIADALVVPALELWADDCDPHGLLRVLGNATAAGRAAVVAHLPSLPEDRAELVCSWLAEQANEELARYVGERLDQDDRIAEHVLRRASLALTTPRRIERVVALLDPADLRACRFAMDALCTAGIYHRKMLEVQLEEGGDGTGSMLAALVGKAGDRLPPGAVVALLGHRDPVARAQVAASLIHAAVDYRVARRLHEIATSDEDPRPRSAAAIALTLAGSSEQIRDLWQGVAPELREAIALALLERRGADRATLVAGLLAQTGGEPGNLAEPLLLALSRLGDAHATDALLRRLDGSDPALARRLGPIAGQLTPAHLPQLDAMLGAAATHAEVRLAIVRWFAARPDLPVQEILQRVRAGGDETLAGEALQGLLRGATRVAIVRELRERLGRPFDAKALEVAYEVLGALEPPYDPDTLELVAEVALAGLGRERPGRNVIDVHALRAPRYALHTTIIDLLRRDPNLQLATLTGRIEALLGEDRPVDPEALTGLMYRAAPWPRLREGVAAPIARWLSAHATLAPPLWAMAQLLVAEQDERAGRFAAAADSYQAALRGAYRTPLPNVVSRAFLEDPDPAARILPLALLAAHSHLCRARALHPNDPARAHAELAMASALAFGDHRAERLVLDWTPKLQ